MRDLLTQGGRGNDPRDARIEWELEDDAPDGRRRTLHGVHQARRSFVQQKTEEQKSEINDVQVDRVQRLAGLHEVADQIRAADEDDEPVEDRGMFEPLARSRFLDCRRRFDLRLAENDAEIARRLPAPGRRRYQPHHGRDHGDLDDDGHEALPEKNRVAERDDSARDHAVVGDDLPDLWLQRSGRCHLQRSRSAQALRPDAAEAEEAGGGERSIVHALDAARDFFREHGAEDEAESPVEP